METLVLESLFLQRLKLATSLKKRLWHRCFPVNFTKLLKTPFLSEHILKAIFEASVHDTIVTAVVYYNMYHC